MTYPDGEILTYTYDAGGLLTHAEGVKRGNRYVYVGKLYYDEFGQRTYIEYGNGVTTTYTYDDTTRRLKHLTTVALDRTGPRNIQNIDYAYDLVGNIMSTDNTHVPYPPGGSQGGPTYQAFTYDNLYQLTTANGWHQSSNTQRTSYTNNIYYDIIGNITSKVQTHAVGNTNPRETNYSWNYNYSTNGVQPHAVISTTDVLTGAGVKNYAYDLDGNMTSWTSQTSGQNRTITWNEENRVKSIADQGSTTVFLYNDAGERALKRGQYGETVYVNRFYSVKNGGIESKHVFAGETRVVTKLELDGGGLQTGVPGSIALTVSQGIQNAITRGSGRQIGINRRLNPGTGAANPPIEKFEFFYHGDHLGSSNFITDDSGAVYQELEYFPYGETWVDDGHTSSRIPGYQFTGKELDPETGLYYYGARYYDPQLSRWISADPILERYLNGKPNEGIYRAININLYRYAANNPLRMTDPTGRSDEDNTSQNAQQTEDDKLIQQAQQLHYSQAKAVKEFQEKGAPIAEAAAALNPLISATEAISGKSSIQGRQLSIGERLLAIPYIGGIFKALGLAKLFRIETKAGKALWGAWGDYEKVAIGEREYAKIGERLYTQHAVERMMPRGLTTEGRSISPNFIEDILQTVTPVTTTVDGVQRQIYRSGSVEIVTEQAGKVVVTVNPFKY